MNPSRPNILLIFTDQFRADCIAAAGTPLITPPNLDRLYRTGTTFDRCYTPSPFCVPARHALTSGQAPHLTGCVDNVDIECHRNSFMDELNMLEYQTHGVGKMHFINGKGDWDFQSRDVSEELEEDSEPVDDYRDYLVKNGYSHVLDPHGLRSEFYHLPQPSQLPDRLHNNAWVADRSIDFLNRRDPGHPFFLWSSFIKPHPPFESPLPWSRLYRMHEMEEPIRPDTGRTSKPSGTACKTATNTAIPDTIAASGSSDKATKAPTFPPTHPASRFSNRSKRAAANASDPQTTNPHSTEIIGETSRPGNFQNKETRAYYSRTPLNSQTRSTSSAHIVIAEWIPPTIPSISYLDSPPFRSKVNRHTRIRSTEPILKNKRSPFR